MYGGEREQVGRLESVGHSPNHKKAEKGYKKRNGN